MIFLKRIFSETGLFDPIVFREGINVISGKYVSEEKSQEINGIGKSTLIRLVDFCLLSDSGKNHFDVKDLNFLKNHSCTLEIETEDGEFQIKRIFEKPSKAYFGKKDELREYSDAELREILGAKFFVNSGYQGLIESSWFRNLIGFFIKDDLNQHERTNPINFVSIHKRFSTLWYLNFFLFGIPNNGVYEYDQNSEEIKKLRDAKKSIEDKASETGGDLAKLEMQEIEIEKKIKLLRKGLESYKFIDSYRDIQDELVLISKEIASRLANYSFFKRKLVDIRESYKIDFNFDSKAVVSLYEEAKAGLGEVIVKPIEEAIKFRRDIAENRKTFLAKKEFELNHEIKKIEGEIQDFESRRSQLYKTLDEKEAIDSIKNSYEELIEQKAKLEQILSLTGKVQSINESIADLDIKLSEVIKKIMIEVRNSSSSIEEIKVLFNDFVSKAIETNDVIGSAYLDIKARPDKRSPVEIVVEVPKSDSLGKSRFKILSYDITIFLNLIKNKRNMPSFLIHDGIFHSVGIKTVINVLNYIYDFSKTERFQYIFSINENEINIPKEKEALYGKLNFDLEKVKIVEFEDIPEKMFFKKEFRS